MKALILVFNILIVCSSCKSQLGKTFPNSSDIITIDFAEFDKFFPIASLDLRSKGIDEQIHIVYPYLDYRADNSQFFIKNDNPGVFSFEILKNGKLKPLFTTKALHLAEKDTQYFNASKRVYDSAKKVSNPFLYLKFPEKPEWWQMDQTPIKANGEAMTFICQIDLHDLTKHDCRMFIFYDSKKRIIKNICQWD